MMTPRGVASVTLRSWGHATVDFLIAAVGLFVVVFPALSVVVTLVTGDPLGAGSAGFVAFVVATGGSYPFVAGDWPYGRLGRFVAALLVTTATASLLGLAALSRLDVALPSPVVARAAVLAVAYPVATVVAFTERFRLDRNPTTVPEE
jgi:hypothetical protein